MLNKRKRLAIVLTVYILIVGGILSLYILQKLGYIELKCGWYECGILCMGCGITRAFDALLRFDLYQAFRYNPFIIGLGWYYVYCVLDISLVWVKTGDVTDKHTKNLIIYLVLLVLFGVLRNTEMFHFLAPTVVTR